MVRSEKRIRSRRALGVCAAVLWLSSPAMAVAKGADKKVDAKAGEVLRGMSDFLASQQSFTVDVHSSVESVENGTKVQYAGEGKVQVARPNRLRVDRAGEMSDLSLFYDGKTLTVLAKNANAYAQTRAPATLDDTLDMAADRLALYPPGGDLLHSRTYDQIAADAKSGSYLGKTQIDGVPVHHLVFRGEEVDTQIWIEDGAKPVPRKMVVTSKDMEQAPQYSVELSGWNLAPRLGDEVFRFSAPKGAEKIAFMAAPKPGEEKKKGDAK